MIDLSYLSPETQKEIIICLWVIIGLGISYFILRWMP